MTIEDICNSKKEEEENKKIETLRRFLWNSLNLNIKLDKNEFILEGKIENMKLSGFKNKVFSEWSYSYIDYFCTIVTHLEIKKNWLKKKVELVSSYVRTKEGLLEKIQIHKEAEEWMSKNGLTKIENG